MPIRKQWCIKLEKKRKKGNNGNKEREQIVIYEIGNHGKLVELRRKTKHNINKEGLDIYIDDSVSKNLVNKTT